MDKARVQHLDLDLKKAMFTSGVKSPRWTGLQRIHGHGAAGMKRKQRRFTAMPDTKAIGHGCKGGRSPLVAAFGQAQPG